MVYFARFRSTWALGASLLTFPVSAAEPEVAVDPGPSPAPEMPQGPVEPEHPPDESKAAEREVVTPPSVEPGPNAPPPPRASKNLDSIAPDPTQAPRSRAPAPQAFRFLSLDAFELRLAIGGGVAWFDPEAARAERFGTSGATFDIELGMELFDLASVAVGFGAMFPPDHGGFYDEVVPMFKSGEPRTADSELQIVHSEVTIGPRTPNFCLGPALSRETEEGSVPIDNCIAVHAFARFGKNWAHAERIIANCANCRDQSIDLADGAILDAGLEFGLPSRQGVGAFVLIGFRQAFGGAIRHHLRFELGAAFL
jgi:hypothetical protein